jgi:hypothetical protein
VNQPARTPSPQENLLTRYFRSVPSRPSHAEAFRWMGFGGAVAVLGLLFGIAGGSGGPLLAIILVVCAAALAGKGVAQMLREKYAYQKSLVSVFPQPSDHEVDRWLADGLDRLRRHSLEKLDLTPEECEQSDLPPIVGPVLWIVNGVAPEDVVWKRGQDGTARFGAYEVSYLWLADEHLGIFTCHYDLIRDAILNEVTYGFFYRDIVSVSTHEEASALTLPTGQSLTSRQEFRISVANGSYFAMTVGSDQLKELTGAERIPEPGTDQAIRALRSKLREKKGALPTA